MLNFYKKIKYFYWRYIVSPENYARHIGVKIGKDCFISTREWSSEPYLISIGDHCQITRNVSIHTHGGGQSIRQIDPDFDAFGKVTIGNWVYIGASSHIMPGVTIGDGVLVAAGSVVTKSIPPHVVVGGNPAKVICTTQEFLKRNEQYNVHTKRKGMNDSEKKFFLLGLPSDKLITKKYLCIPTNLD